MHSDHVTTPFGRRPITLALVRGQQAAGTLSGSKTADKWKVFRDACAAMEPLGLQSASLAVLDALLSFHPQKELRGDGQLVVFPSNVQLSLRAHGMAPSTLRRHLAALVDAGLIIRRDSANGKRFARRGTGGEVETAFGFDLAPLLLRADELATLAETVLAARETLRKLREKLTICRRDTRKLLSAAMEEQAEGDWQSVEDIYIGLVARIPRRPTLRDVSDALESMELLKEEILNRLQDNGNSMNPSTSDGQNERHIQNSNPEPCHESEPSSGKELGRPLGQEPPPLSLREGREKVVQAPIKAFPLGLVLRACPQIVEYGPNGRIEHWREMMKAAVVVRSFLGVSPSAYEEACETMGPENAAVAIACILERSNVINSAGGYLRDLTRRAQRGEFSLGPMLMALLRANGESGERTG